jgi:type VI secretion system protein VasG
LLQIPREALRKGLPDLLASSAEDAGGAARAGAGRTCFRGGAPAPAKQMPTMRRGNSNTPSLDQYTVDMTQLARDGAIDPIRGRDAEIRQIVDVLAAPPPEQPHPHRRSGRRQDRRGGGLRPAHRAGRRAAVAAPGVVRTLDLGLLQAGAGVKGEFENRLKSVIAEVKASPTPIILFIDEAHQADRRRRLRRPGRRRQPAQARARAGRAAHHRSTTWAEYKKYIERDPALTRRFQVVKIEEPTEDVAIDMLRGMVATLEKHHGVEILTTRARCGQALAPLHLGPPAPGQGDQRAGHRLRPRGHRPERPAAGNRGRARDISSAENQLRILRHESATGRNHEQAIATLSLELQEHRQRHKRLSDKLARERTRSPRSWRCASASRTAFGDGSQPPARTAR